MIAVEFSPSGFAAIVDAARMAGYAFVRPDEQADQGLLLRHDVDLSLRSAVQLAELEASLGVASTFFVMARSAFYSVTSPEAAGLLRRIVDAGHAIGLHWDAGLYDGSDAAAAVTREIDLLQWITGTRCIAISHHQPSLHGLVEIDIPGVVNMYAPKVQEQYAYVSDSCMSFRDGPFATLARRAPLQLLLHPEYWSPGGSSLEAVCRELALQESQIAVQRFDRECELMIQTVRRRPEFDGDLRRSMTPGA